LCLVAAEAEDGVGQRAVHIVYAHFGRVGPAAAAPPSQQGPGGERQQGQEEQGQQQGRATPEPSAVQTGLDGCPTLPVSTLWPRSLHPKCRLLAPAGLQR
jgi:hypothetical protein